MADLLSRRRLLFLGGAAGGAAAAGPVAAASSFDAPVAEARAPVDVRRFGASGDGKRDDARALSTTVRHALAEAKVLGVPTSIRLPRGRYRIARSLWLEPEIAVIFDPGAIVEPDAGTTLTIHGPVVAGSHRLFAGAGDVRLERNGVVNVAWFGAEDGRESTAAFRRAIDALVWGKTVTWRQGRGTVDVPPTRKGFVVKGLRLPSGIRLRGAGANGSMLVNDGTDGQPTLVVGHQDKTVIRDVRIEGLYLQGNPACGDGIVFEDHAYNEVFDCVVRGHGGHGIVLRKVRSTMSDSLSLTDVTVVENRRAGLRMERNSHGLAAYNCEFLNNVGGNVIAEGTYFNMWGGQINGIEDGDGIRLISMNSGGLWGVGFEATPAIKNATTLVRIEVARGFVIAGCDFTPSGNDGDCTCIRVERALDCTLISPFFDGNCKGAITALAVGKAAENLQVISPRFGRNHGPGGFVPLENRSATTALQSGHGRPLLPAFVATTSKDARLATERGRYAAVRFDRLGHGTALGGYDATAGRFVAPVDGLYHFDAQLPLGAAAAIRLSAGSETIPGLCAAQGEEGGPLATLSASVRLRRGQAAKVELAVPGGGALLLRAGARFSGHLIA